MIDQQPLLLLDIGNLQLPLLVAGYCVAYMKLHPGDRGIVLGINSVLATGREQQGHHASFEGNHGTQTQIGLGITNPTLAKCKRHSQLQSHTENLREI